MSSGESESGGNPVLLVTKESRDFLVAQMEKIKSASSWRVTFYFIALALTIIDLIALIKLEVDIPDSGKVLVVSSEDYFFNSYASLLREEDAVKDSKEILHPFIEDQINVLTSKLDRDMTKSELVRETWYTSISFDGAIPPPMLSRKFYLGFRNGIAAQRQPGPTEFFKFQHVTAASFPGSPQLEYTTGQKPDLDKEIRKLYRLEPSDPIQNQHIISNEGFSLLLQANLTEQIVADINKSMKLMSQDLKDKLKQNKAGFDDLQKGRKNLREDHDNKIRAAIEAPTSPEQYARAISRTSVSIVLVTVALTIIILIRNEVTLFSKIQSVIVLAGGITFSLKDISLFDALNRLHGYKGHVPDTKALVEYWTKNLFEHYAKNPLGK